MFQRRRCIRAVNVPDVLIKKSVLKGTTVRHLLKNGRRICPYQRSLRRSGKNAWKGSLQGRRQTSYEPEHSGRRLFWRDQGRHGIPPFFEQGLKKRTLRKYPECNGTEHQKTSQQDTE